MTPNDYMALALKEAEKGMGFVSPNPMVGAVIVKDGRIISKGCHERYGQFHAERNAINRCPEDMTGAQIYVTLEPCCHTGKTPPCTQAIIDSGISEVFVGSFDPNPLVAGKGTQILRDHGITVHEGVLREECDKLNRIFFHYITGDTPYVIFKYAMTADGKIADHEGKSQWISGEKSRADVQKLRFMCSSIMAGINTVLKDDPMLTCRINDQHKLTRVICDSSLKIPLDCNIMKTAADVPTVIACTDGADRDKAEKIKAMGAEVIFTGTHDGHVNLRQLMKALHDKKIDSVLLEGGGELAHSMFKAKLVSRVIGYISPKILGGKTALSPVGGEGFDINTGDIKLSAPEITLIDSDIKAQWEEL